MDYLIAMGLGLVTFISPCVLPLLPVFVTYFTQGKKTNVFSVLLKVLAFVMGITIVFLFIYLLIAYGAYETGSAGQSVIEKHKDKINAVCGIVLVVLGLKFMGYLDLPFLNKSISYTPKQKKSKKNNSTENEESTEPQNELDELNEQPNGITLISSFIMGLAFSLSMGSCSIGWGVALTDLIWRAGSFFKASLVIIAYVISIDIFLIIFAMGLNQLKGVLKFILRHQNVISKVCGVIMILLGFIIALGFMDKIMSLMPQMHMLLPLFNITR